jgi:hypothetical protein
MNVAPSVSRWFHPTPGRLIACVLVLEGLLFLADWFRWLPKGYAALVAVAAVLGFMALMLLMLAVAAPHGCGLRVEDHLPRLIAAGTQFVVTRRPTAAPSRVGGTAGDSYHPCGTG